MRIEDYDYLIKHKEEELAQLHADKEKLLEEEKTSVANADYAAGDIVLVDGVNSINPYSIQLIIEVKYNRIFKQFDYSTTALVPCVDEFNVIRLTANIANYYATYSDKNIVCKIGSIGIELEDAAVVSRHELKAAEKIDIKDIFKNVEYKNKI